MYSERLPALSLAKKLAPFPIFNNVIITFIIHNRVVAFFQPLPQCQVPFYIAELFKIQSQSVRQIHNMFFVDTIGSNTLPNHILFINLSDNVYLVSILIFRHQQIVQSSALIFLLVLDIFEEVFFIGVWEYSYNIPLISTE